MRLVGYLCALSLNPEARHIWSYLRICFTCMERFDLVNKVDAGDPNAFRGDFPGFDNLDAPPGLAPGGLPMGGGGSGGGGAGPGIDPSAAAAAALSGLQGLVSMGGGQQG